MNGLPPPRGGGGDYADLEMAVHRRDAVTWTVELRYLPPGSEVETKLEASGPLQVGIDPRQLDDIEDDEEYGLELGKGLFGGGVGPAFQTAVATSQRDGVPLRVRLVIGSSATVLHGLRWETLRTPGTGTTLLTNENILFSRYLSSQDWRPVGVRPREELAALVVVAAPSDLGSIRAGRPLAPVDVEGELERARKNLTYLDVTTLPGPNGNATAADVIDH